MSRAVKRNADCVVAIGISTYVAQICVESKADISLNSERRDSHACCKGNRKKSELHCGISDMLLNRFVGGELVKGKRLGGFSAQVN